MARVLPPWTALLLPANAVLSSSLLWSPDLLVLSFRPVLSSDSAVPGEAVLSMRSVLTSAGASSLLASALPVCYLYAAAGVAVLVGMRLGLIGSRI